MVVLGLLLLADAILTAVLVCLLLALLRGRNGS